MTVGVVLFIAAAPPAALVSTAATVRMAVLWRRYGVDGLLARGPSIADWLASALTGLAAVGLRLSGRPGWAEVYGTLALVVLLVVSAAATWSHRAAGAR